MTIKMDTLILSESETKAIKACLRYGKDNTGNINLWDAWYDADTRRIVASNGAVLLTKQVHGGLPIEQSRRINIASFTGKSMKASSILKRVDTWSSYVNYQSVLARYANQRWSPITGSPESRQAYRDLIAKGDGQGETLIHVSKLGASLFACSHDQPNLGSFKDEWAIPRINGAYFKPELWMQVLDFMGDGGFMVTRDHSPSQPLLFTRGGDKQALIMPALMP